MIVKLFMKSGNVIEVPHVEDATITQGLNGAFTKWSITWKDGFRPVALLSISLPDLEAFLVLKDEADEAAEHADKFKEKS